MNASHPSARTQTHIYGKQKRFRQKEKLIEERTDNPMMYAI